MATPYSIKAVSKHTIIYGLGPVFQKSIGFLLIPIYTKYLTPSDYGLLELITIAMTIWIMVGNQGMGTAFFRYYPWDEPKKEPLFVSTVYLYIFGSGGLLLVLTFLAIGLVNPRYFEINEVDINVFLYIGFLTAFMQLLVVIPYQRLRAKMQSKRYVIVSSVGFSANLLLNIVFIVVYHMNLFGLLLGNLVSSFIVAVALTTSIRDAIRIEYFSRELMRKMLRYGLPLITGGFSYYLLTITDRLFIQTMCTTSDLGLFSLGGRIANILGIVVIGPFLLIWPSIYFSWSQSEEGGQSLGKITRLFFGALCLVALMLSISSPSVIRTIAHESFWNSYQYVPFLIVAQIGWAFYNIKHIGLTIANKTSILTIIFTGTAVINAILNYFFIKKFGSLGAAVATATSYAILSLATDIVAKRYYRLQLSNARLTIIFLGFFIPSLIYYSTGLSNLPTWHGKISALILFLIGTVAILLSSLHRSEILRSAHWINQQLKKRSRMN